MNKTKMISTEKDFQSSVNIAYDLHDEKKIKNFIPTAEAVHLFETIFESTHDFSTKRAHILIGAYGKGKSHIVLEILSLLSKKNKSLFTAFLSKLQKMNFGLCDDVQNYIESNKKILPIIISGSSTSLSQSFLYSLYQTLKQNDFADLMPDTNFIAAVNTINKWKIEFPATYNEFGKKINIPISEYIERLKNFDTELYSDFLDLYPQLTSGSEFNPFAGFDIVELYEKVNKKLIDSNNGYCGMFIVYDEFSKYLESSIGKASINDIKLLQDFAEKCCRSGKNQMHLLLISHKEISNYIDTLPKEKVDGWKGVSERFNHIIMHSDYSQVYEIMNAVIIKDYSLWNEFLEVYKHNFENICTTQTFKKLFANCSENEIHSVVKGCYPLHHATTYILPRFSEKIAQNERTMFTFLSADEKNTLSSFIKDDNYATDGKPKLLTPDLLFDYFENQMRGEPYTSPIKSYYNTAKTILSLVEENSLEEKIIKTISIIYSLNQFERLPPTAEVIHDIYCDAGFSFERITQAINFLTKENVLFLRRSNNFLQLKERSGADIESLILNMVEKRKNKFSEITTINELNSERYIYPVEYNTTNEMIRYFEVQFVSSDDFLKKASITAFESKSRADGVIVCILPNEESQKKVEEYIKEKSAEAALSVFVLPSKFVSVSNELKKIDAINYLKAENADDSVLFDEYTLIEQDLKEIVENYIHSYTHPEFGKCNYFAKGESQKLFRKSALTHLLSSMCNDVYTKTPVINNEPLNKTELTGAARKSRAILIDAILNATDSNLGITGGQELSFKRSALCVPHILNEKENAKFFDIESYNLEKNFKNLFCVINCFIEKSKEKPQCFETLVQELTGKYNCIGIRLGIIPIYVAVALSKIANNVVIKGKAGELKLNADTMCGAVENPSEYFLAVVPWSKDKENYISKLEKRFSDYFVQQKKHTVGYNYLLNGIVNWMRELPKYSKEVKPDTPKEYSEFLNILKMPEIGAQEILFNKTKEIFNSEEYSTEIFNRIDSFKHYYDTALNQLEAKLISFTKKMLVAVKCGASENETLCNCGKKFCDSLDKRIAEHKFENHAENVYETFSSCGNDENKIITTLAVTLTGINTADWSESTISIYEKRFCEYISTLKNYKSAESVKNNPEIKNLYTEKQKGTYVINFVNEKGDSIRRDFDKVECSKKALILQSEIKNILEEYGQSVNDGEKRQVLIKILEELTK